MERDDPSDRANLGSQSRLDDPAVMDLFACLQPDLIGVACFPRLIPPALLALPRLGVLNVHPSLLPGNRGPVPLFWTFQDGREDFVIHPAQWDARHVYNFICGVKDWGETLTLVADPELTLVVEDVLDYSYKPNDLRLHTRERAAWPVRCQRGVVVVKGQPLKYSLT